MKKALKLFVDGLLELFYRGVIVFFKYVNLLRGKKRVLLFTDSRGADVTSLLRKRNPFGSYVGAVMIDYCCDIYICPKKHTSLLDFLELMSKKKTSYELVVLHCGIVDFAPRPKSSYEQMFDKKVNVAHKLGLDISRLKFLQVPGALYMGEPTYTFMNEDMLDIVISRLVGVPNIVYIGINPILLCWRGAYWRDRPSNINEQLIFDKKLRDKISRSIDLSNWSASDVKKYTVDNVHYNKTGFHYLYDSLRKYLP